MGLLSIQHPIKWNGKHPMVGERESPIAVFFASFTSLLLANFAGYRAVGLAFATSPMEGGGWGLLFPLVSLTNLQE
jgi:hypothetical protein